MTQWHPIFDLLLRATLQDYYEVQTNVAVGDMPREADIVVVRRAGTARPPFRTLWKNLSRWNVLEFKGRSESARVNDVDLLVEVGLGIHRRLQEQEPGTKIGRADVSFWYLANHLGKRFLRDVIELTGNLEAVSVGLWRGNAFGRPLWLVSNRDVPIDNESAPVSVVSEQSIEHVRELAQIVIDHDKLWDVYFGILGSLNPTMRKELQIMATKRNKGDIDWQAFINSFDDAEFAQFLNKHVERRGFDWLVEGLSPKKREALLRVLQAETGKKNATKS